jgi:hypothetical protein
LLLLKCAGECDWLVDPAATGHKRGAITAIAAALPQRTRKAVWQYVRSNYTPTEVQVGAAGVAVDAVSGLKDLVTALGTLPLHYELCCKWDVHLTGYESSLTLPVLLLLLTLFEFVPPGQVVLH